MRGLTGRKAIVTGGGRGIGQAIVEAFVVRGVETSVLDRSPGPCVPPSPGRAELHGYEVDVADFASVGSQVERAVADMGGVDILVNCAGINRDRVIWKMTETEWDEVIAVDLKGCFNTTRAVVGRMREQKFGRIVNIASINGLRGKFGQVNYSAAKAGVVGMTKALAKELGAFGVTVNCVCPGLVLTEMVRAAPPEIVDQAMAEMSIKALPEPDDIAAAVLFFASDEARRITGEVIRVDSGQYI